MAMKYYYSPAENLMYSDVNRSAYEASNMWPSDLIEISEGVFSEYAGTPPTGKMRNPGDNGLPTWVDVPPPTKDELIAFARAEKSKRLSSANEVINPLIDAVEFGIATNEEHQLCDEWRKYRVLLSRVDISQAPDIEWPELPI